MKLVQISDTSIATTNACARICGKKENAYTFATNSSEPQLNGGVNSVKILLAKIASGSDLEHNTQHIAGDTKPSVTFQPKYSPILLRGMNVCVALKSLEAADECLSTYSYVKFAAGFIVKGISSVSAQDGVLDLPSIVDTKNLVANTVPTVWI